MEHLSRISVPRPRDVGCQAESICSAMPEDLPSLLLEAFLLTKS